MEKEFHLYNTLSRKVESVKPVDPGHLRFYSCGPTVYSYAHIGNFRSFLTADLIVRVARAIEWRVSYATNITDVGHLTEDDLADATGEDRMVRALRSGEGERFANIWDLARYFTSVMLEDWRSLNLLEPTVRPRATEHMGQQIRAVMALVESGHAYATSSGVYFSVASFPEYGRLSGNVDAEGLEQSVRDVVQDPEKRDPRDFALWKMDESHLMQWHSPWGWGYPGWHLECSVMAQAYLGEQIDLHAGGEDLIFPHHECEIAQAESLTGKPFARHWVHTRFLQVEGEKMSKRTGNFYTVRDLVLPESEGGRGVDPLALRLTLLSGHYRKPFNFTFDTLRASIRHRERFVQAAEAADAIEAAASAPDRAAKPIPELDVLYERALDAMLDDLNTPEALAVVFEGTRLVLSQIESGGPGSAAACRDWLRRIDDLLGIVYPGSPESAHPVDGETEEIEGLVAERTKARAERNFARADEIRMKLEALGVEVMDTPRGPKWKRITVLE